jgi:hypothetical protein
MKASKEMMANLHNAVAEELLGKILSGEATAAELNVARGFLKDNGIDGTLDQSQPLHNLAKSLPFDVDAGAA